MTLLQVYLAVIVTPQEGPLSYRYSILVQHDSYWFENIARHGYHSTVPPTTHKLMEVSNVAFFPAYPLLARTLAQSFDLDLGTALLVVAQLAAWGFWSYLFLFFEEWMLPVVFRFFGALGVLAHPAAFFLVAGYSESLFLMMLFGLIYWSGRETRWAKGIACAHGFVMAGTRIVGVVCAGYPVVRSLARKGGLNLTRPRLFIRQHSSAVLLSVLSMLGTVAFFFYCQLRWGCWNLYMQTQESGWAVEADYLAVFRPSSYEWLVPDLDDPTQMSQMIMTVTAILFVVVAICEVIPIFRRSTQWRERLGFYFCATAIYYVSVSGVASVDMESMLRYEFCTHALLVLALLHYLREFGAAPVFVRAFGMAVAGLAAAAGLALQCWYVWNFTQGNWVA